MVSLRLHHTLAAMLMFASQVMYVPWLTPEAIQGLWSYPAGTHHPLFSSSIRLVADLPILLERRKMCRAYNRYSLEGRGSIRYHYTPLAIRLHASQVMYVPWLTPRR